MPTYQALNVHLSAIANTFEEAEQFLSGLCLVDDHVDYGWDSLREVPDKPDKVYLILCAMDTLDQAIDAALKLGLHEWETVRKEKFVLDRPLTEAPRETQIQVLIDHANLTAAGQLLVHLTEQLHALNLRLNIEEGMY